MKKCEHNAVEIDRQNKYTNTCLGCKKTNINVLLQSFKRFTDGSTIVYEIYGYPFFGECIQYTKL